jgi:predicted adenylyl cyclase CyaB
MEIEKRFRVDNETYDYFVNKLQPGNADRVVDVTFGPSGARSMQEDGWVLRLRSKNDIVKLEYKAPANTEWTAWNEISVTVDKLGKIAKILNLIGLQYGLLIERTRRVCDYKGAILSFDRVKYLGNFIEIEVNCEDERRGLAEISRLRTDIGLEGDGDRPYGELLLNLVEEDNNIRDEMSKEIESLMAL